MAAESSVAAAAWQGKSSPVTIAFNNENVITIVGAATQKRCKVLGSTGPFPCSFGATFLRSSVRGDGKEGVTPTGSPHSTKAKAKEDAIASRHNCAPRFTTSVAQPKFEYSYNATKHRFRSIDAILARRCERC